MNNLNGEIDEGKMIKSKAILWINEYNNDKIKIKEFLHKNNFTTDSVINSTKTPINLDDPIDSEFVYFIGVITINKIISKIIAIPTSIPDNFNYCCLGNRENFQFFNLFIKLGEKLIIISNVLKNSEINDQNWVLKSVDTNDLGYNCDEFEFNLETEEILTGDRANALICRVFFKGENLEELGDNLICLANVEFNKVYLGIDN